VPVTRTLQPGVDFNVLGMGDGGKARGPLVFVGYGIEEDGAAVKHFLAQNINFFVSTSFSKSFSLYGERVGALSVVCGNAEECSRVLSQLKIVIRTNYSNPPTFGAQVVAMVLSTPDLRAMWEEELQGMRVRIRAHRQWLAQHPPPAAAA
jgi:aromatic-amino-acid transaminase